MPIASGTGLLQGIRIQAEDGAIGTVSCAMRGYDFKTYLICAAHVMASRIHQPSSNEDPIYLLDSTGRRQQQIATLNKWMPQVTFENQLVTMDAAIAVLAEGQHQVLQKINWSETIFQGDVTDGQRLRVATPRGLIPLQARSAPFSCDGTFHTGHASEFTVTLTDLIACDEVASSVIDGDSGGAVFDANGTVVGIVYGEAHGQVYLTRIDHIVQQFELWAR